MKLYLILIAGAAGSMALNAYFINNAHNMASMLDQCAQTENVYKCKLTAVPVTAPKVVYVQPDLLPPPVKG